MVDHYEDLDPKQFLLVTYFVTLSNGQSFWTSVQGIPSTTLGQFYEGCFSTEERVSLQNSITEFKSKKLDHTQAIYFSTYH